MLRKNFYTCLGLLAAVSIYAQNTQLSAQGYYKKQCDLLLQYDGIWITKNYRYNEKDSTAASYYGYEFSKGINDNTLLIERRDYYPHKSEWKTQWTGYYTWDAKKQKVVCNGLYSDGSISNGELESISDGSITIITSITTQKGSIEKRKDITKITADNLSTQGFIQKNNQWVPEARYSWQKLELPKATLAFMSTRDGNFEIYTMDTKGENLKNLSCNKATDYAFTFFPRSARLLFYSNRDSNDEIYIQEADGRKQVNITNHPAGDRIPAVSPDGNQILFVSDRDHKSGEIYLVDADGKNIRRLTSNAYFEDAPHWSHDGKRIFFTRELRDLKDTSANAVGNGEIFVMDIDGSNEKQLTNRPGYDGGPQLSPDGTTIAFYGKSATGRYDLFIMNTDGSHVTNLTNDAREDYSPSWSPDGKWIAFTSGDSKNYDVWLIHLDTKIRMRLTTHARRDESPFWQPVF